MTTASRITTAESRPETAVVDVDGYTTSITAAGSGPAVLYLSDHVLAGHWLPFHEHLAEHVHTILPLHPGFGGSAMPPALRDFTDYVLHYDQLLAELSPREPVHLVGNSFGAWIAAELAVFYPRRFASLTLIAPFGLLVPDEPPVDQFRWNDRERVEVLLNGSSEVWNTLADETKSAEAAVIDRYADSITLARLIWNPRYDVRLEHRLRRVVTPTTVVHPVDDRVASVEQATRFTRAIPGARLCTVDGTEQVPASHLSVLHHPQALSDLVVEHVARTIAKESA